VDSDLRQEVRRAARGDKEAARLLFDNYYPLVYRYALSRVGSAEDAEDIAAETFASVVRGLPSFKWKGGGFEAWLFRIAYNLIVDHYRTSGREQSAEYTFDEEDGRSPEVAFFEGELAKELNDMLSSLSPDQRDVLLLRFAADLTTQEIAHVMQRQKNAIRQLQFRALETLRKHMHEELERR
jgi:RNA polymerase sigma-70 factor (ECF subfamily)